MKKVTINFGNQYTSEVEILVEDDKLPKHIRDRHQIFELEYADLNKNVAVYKLLNVYVLNS